MRILFDLGHPAHVHYFKNLIKLLKKNGNQVLIVAREKDVTHSLLKYYGIFLIYLEEKVQKHYQVNFFTFSKQIYDYINTQFYLNLIFL